MSDQKVLTFNVNGMRAENLHSLLTGVNDTYGERAKVRQTNDGIVVYIGSWDAK